MRVDVGSSTINREMRESVKKAAAKADGARRCDRCELHPCTETIYKICTDMFREGFVKGAAWKQKQLKQKEK